MKAEREREREREEKKLEQIAERLTKTGPDSKKLREEKLSTCVRAEVFKVRMLQGGSQLSLDRRG